MKDGLACVCRIYTIKSDSVFKNSLTVLELNQVKKPEDMNKHVCLKLILCFKDKQNIAKHSDYVNVINTSKIKMLLYSI